MIERGGRQGFPPEALQSLGILRNLLGQELQCNLPMESGVLGLVDDTHPPAAEMHGSLKELVSAGKSRLQIHFAQQGVVARVGAEGIR